MNPIKTVALAAIALLVVAVPSAQAAPVRYAGKTDGGSKITFQVSNGKLRSLETMVPTSCVSAQGGTPRAGLDLFQPPGGFRLGRKVKRSAEKQDTAMTYYDVTKNYTVTTRRSGKAIKGELAVNWSWVDVSVPKIYTCLGNASFSAKPR
jgi:hypothetical protein